MMVTRLTVGLHIMYMDTMNDDNMAAMLMHGCIFKLIKLT